MSADSISTSHIPVLTEIIAASPASGGLPMESVKEENVAAIQNQAAFPSFVVNKRKWDELESRLSERILQLVQERISFILAQSLKDSLAGVLQKAAEELSEEVRNDLQNTLEVVVSHAVSQEIMRLQQADASKTGNTGRKDGS
jgi:hypothetical protein